MPQYHHIHLLPFTCPTSDSGLHLLLPLLLPLLLLDLPFILLQTMKVDVEAMCQELDNAKTGSVVLLHACAHNPTGNVLQCTFIYITCTIT